MLIISLAMFMLGTLCQLYSMFSPEEPYLQQLSFMFVAMPSVLAIINHYYNHHQDIRHTQATSLESHPREERITSLATQTCKRTKSIPSDVAVDTSQHRRSTSGCYDALSGYDCTDDVLLN
jgi:hypothetical protein